ncbi:MAG: DNA recombination protein RmuC [Bacteroidetes bacterium]|nr:DNA recombination protein RmuC [Bacteroidota bacterium]MBS1756203.1 DNA recombination protein RmuC [Bacteroidota bacterium]
MIQTIYIAIGIIIGAVVGWLLAKAKTASAIQAEKDAAQLKYSELEKEFVGYKATATSQLNTATDNLNAKSKEINNLKQTIEANAKEIAALNSQVSTANADLRAASQIILDKNKAIEAIAEELKTSKKELSETTQALATAKATNDALNEKLQTQKEEIEALGKKFNTEFENIANKILETKSEKFTTLNRDNITSILQPLGEKIQDFKKQVEDTYGKESNERASLKTEVKSLLDMNQQLASEAKNLTRALKAEVKTQGRWGEMILEKILDKSGLRKGEEFFMEHQLFDTDGKPLLSTVSGKKMRPDALIKYPDERHVIVDSKVSLNAFLRMTEAETEEAQQAELLAHVKAIKAHIDDLSVKAYEDYSKSMDFVMMFVPNESAYFAALQGDGNLWEYAYDRRILLISPTNLIAALKLISDLWKRERNESNAMAIAERAGKMYEKMVGFVDSLDAVGKNLDLAKGKYDEAVKQLHSGRDNFFGQAAKMKTLLNYQKTKDFSPARLDLGEQNDIEPITK